MNKNYLISALGCLFLLMSASNLPAQIVIGNGGATNVKAADSAHTLLELRNDTSSGNLHKAGRGLLMPRTDSIKKNKMGTYKKPDSIPYGTLVYDTSTHMIFVWTRLSNKSLWRPLAFVGGKKGVQPEFLDIDTTDLETNPFSTTSGSGGGGSSGSNHHTLTIKNPDGYLPYLQLKKDGNTNTHTATPVVDIAYNGLTLVPERDYKATFDPSSGGAPHPNSSSKVKITFLTLEPEKWTDFSRLGIQYMPLEK